LVIPIKKLNSLLNKLVRAALYLMVLG
jgi:hypothetical protein